METYRGFVYPWSIDHIGHMNVRSYASRFDEASWQCLAALGMTPRALHAQGRGFVALEQRTQYQREVLAGSLLHVHSSVTVVDDRKLRLHHRMHDSVSGDQVAEMDLLAGFFDTAARRLAALPPGLTEGASTLGRPAAQPLAESDHGR